MQYELAHIIDVLCIHVVCSNALNCKSSNYYTKISDDITYMIFDATTIIAKSLECADVLN